MSIKNKALAAFGVGAACAACCASFIAPLLFGSGSLGLGSAFGLSQLGLSREEALCAGVIVAALGGVGFWAWRNQQEAKRAKACECETVCTPAKTA
jgi:hypothetical protein